MPVTLIRRIRGSDRRWQAAVGEILASPAGVTGLVLISLVTLLGVFGPFFAPYPPNAPDVLNPSVPPDSVHWLGTDALGRDILSRTLSGILVSLRIGVVSVLLAGLIGIPLGLVSGYFRRVDLFMSRLVELIMVFPGLVLALGLVAILGGPGESKLMIALTVSALPAFIRVTRGEVLRLRNLEFVEAAVTTGASTARILGQHLLPNAVSALLVQFTVNVPGAVLGEAVLSFLGVGVAPPAPSLGVMLAEAQGELTRGGWWMALFPGLAILAITIGFNLFGDAMRDALDPQSRRL